MALALQREQTAYRSLLMVSGAVLADPEPMMLSCMVRGYIALAFVLLAYSLLHAATALLIPSRAASSVT